MDLQVVAPNRANRYSLGDRSPGIGIDADGGITIYIQHDSPGEDKEANWLPCPDSGTWFVILRMYQPHESVVNASWKCPGIRKL